MNYKIFVILFALFIISCKGNKKSSLDKYIDFNSIVENDTLSFNKVPKNLNDWLDYYKKTDTLFLLSNFKASGVILHTSTLSESDTIQNVALKLKPLFEYSPDGSTYIDIWSYGHQNIPDTAWNSRLELAKILKDGEPDQQVVLGMKDGKRYELMFNGPESISEFAEWINNDQFLISQITKDHNNFIVELFLFDIKEKLFTNYRLNHTPSIDFEGETYVEHWITETDKLIK
jgi:hypothetical protein